MMMIDAMAALRDESASYVRRQCWHHTRKLYLADREGGRREIWLACGRRAHGWYPHSMDAVAQDWEIVK